MFVSCKHLKVIVKAIIKVIVTARTKRGKILFKSRIKGSLLPTPTPLLGTRETLHIGREAPCGSKVKV